MSQVAYVSEIVTVPEPTPIEEDIPCPVCGAVCPNELYCVNCGYVNDSLLKKYQTPEQIEEENKKQEEYRIAASEREKAKRKQSKHHALMVKIGREFKRQNGKAAGVGDIVRRKKQDGSYDKGAFWYIKTPNGWMSSPSKKRKPTKAQINRVCQDKKKK